ncbi:MAG: hypothetical protein Fur0018_11050 [Anaerolineales bacterium]
MTSFSSFKTQLLRHSRPVIALIGLAEGSTCRAPQRPTLRIFYLSMEVKRHDTLLRSFKKT